MSYSYKQKQKNELFIQKKVKNINIQKWTIYIYKKTYKNELFIQQKWIIHILYIYKTWIIHIYKKCLFIQRGYSYKKRGYSYIQKIGIIIIQKS